MQVDVLPHRILDCAEETTLLGLWAGEATREDQSAEKANGSGAASTRTAGSVTRCWEEKHAKELGHGQDVRS